MLTYYKFFMQRLLAAATAEETIEVGNECFRYNNLCTYILHLKLFKASI